ncbi:putative endonuclease exonuclease phosphatase family protein [Rosellinia necatrix]|uniref:Putative endonuclease exonuclease phosphatase family protein n=1 Tax=Rosellinia necatrix TaxID=77044 RepID=A0A1W2TCL5_ROSNE|nr:putative endonuclease exonuclease phosphatase family protein [Rosellinia necatrix]
MKTASALACAALAATAAWAQSIGEINGNRFLSPYAGQKVYNVTGVVTAKGPSGIWLRSLAAAATRDERVSDGIYVFGSALARDPDIAPGDVVALDGTVSEYRSAAAYVPLTEIVSPALRAVLARNQSFAPIALGGGAGSRSPPTRLMSGLDGGDVFGLPNNRSLISVENPVLQPRRYGLDFWESLVGEYVTVASPRAVGRPNQYGDTWVVGTWATTGDNQRTGLTVSPKDANPEAILIGTPLDGTRNPDDGKLGDKLEDITGVVTQAFGFYQIQPLTKLSVISSPAPASAGPTTLVSDGASCAGITVGAYNIENFAAGDAAHVAAVAAHIVDYMRAPDLLAVQEVQDDSGAADDGTVSSSRTLAALADAIAARSNGTALYNFTYISPVDGTNGGAPGGNIRNAYLYKPAVLRLAGGVAAVPGDALTANEVLAGPALRYNPGLIDPTNAAWTDSRKPLVAAWELVGRAAAAATQKGKGKGKTPKPLFTINVHLTSKGGSTSLHGDARPPVNGGAGQRTAQAEAAAAFAAGILARDADARVLAVGDFNEFGFAAPVETFAAASGLRDLDEVAGVPAAERYSYLYDMNSQELDHAFVSRRLARGARFEHLHLNTWLAYDDMVSDHDPSVAMFDLC